MIEKCSKVNVVKCQRNIGLDCLASWKDRSVGTIDWFLVISIYHFSMKTGAWCPRWIHIFYVKKFIDMNITLWFHCQIGINFLQNFNENSMWILCGYFYINFNTYNPHRITQLKPLTHKQQYAVSPDERGGVLCTIFS